MRQSIRVGIGISVIALSAALIGGYVFADGSGPPSSARPGQCFGRVQLPGGVERTKERVLVRPGSSDQRWIPAVKRWTEKRELVKAAWTETLHTPAVYATQVDYVLEAGPRRIVSTPARYRRVVERVLIEPARTVWRPGRGGIGYGGEPGGYSVQPTGEVLCRVRIPARYATRVRLVQVSPGCRCEVEAPPVRRRIVHRVLVRPAGETQRPHAALYRTVRVCEIVQPGHAYTVSRPAEYRTVEHERQVMRQGWSQVICQNGLSASAMARMQEQLAARGYDPGPADGVGRPQTYDALRHFQHQHGLAEGQITVESGRALGVIR